MVIENLILLPRHASHRGSALPATHPFTCRQGGLRVYRPITRRLDRSRLSRPTILHPSLERERERERREKSRCSGRREKGEGARKPDRVSGLCRLAWAFSRRARLATVETRVPPANAARSAGQRGAFRRPTRRVPPANAARPTGQCGASHRPTRRAATENNPVLPFARGFCADATPCFRRGHKAATYIQLQLFLQRKTAPSPEVAAGLL